MPASSAGVTMPNNFFHTLLTQILTSECWLLGRIPLPADMSLLALARNPDCSLP
jgi:hypothetical protein